MSLIPFLILVAVVVFTCVLLNNATTRIGVPVLLAFILLGVLFGNNGIFAVKFSDYGFAEKSCSAALIFIMFYGGFGTRWQSAKPVATESLLLATLGVVLTAGMTGICCHYLLRWDWVESMLMGSVLSSTDAASVFSILRSRKLGLRNGTAPLLEMESGSNDPCSYMLTILMLSIMQGDFSGWSAVWLIFKQLAFGVLFGALIAKVASEVMHRINFATSGFDSMFIIAIAIFSYALPSLVGGNGYLSTYIVGIILGNQDFMNKREMVHFFDGFTGLMQVYIFFMLGLLARPVEFGKCIISVLVIFAVLLLVARPISIALLLSPFKKYPFRQQCLITFCGLRGASSIVFAIMATAMGGGKFPNMDLFNVVFCVVLLSIAVQGTLIPLVAQKLNMIDKSADVMQTFSDFSDEVDLQFTQINVAENGPWDGKYVKDLGIPKDLLLCMVIKPDESKIVPNGYTFLESGDIIIVCSKSYEGSHKIKIMRHTISEGSRWDGLELRHYPVEKSQVILIRRKGESIIPHGSTVIRSNDILYINKSF